MTVKKILIYHPQTGDKVPQNFPASGFATGGVTKITGVLKQNGEVVKEGTVTKKPPHWIITFENVALGKYTLEVRDVDDGAVPAEVTFQVAKLRQVGITYPQSGAVVYCDNLVAYGPTNEPPVTGTVTIGSNAYNAGQMAGQPVWTIQFLNMTPGTGSLFVVGDNGGTNSSTGLTFVTRGGE